MRTRDVAGAIGLLLSAACAVACDDGDLRRQTPPAVPAGSDDVSVGEMPGADEGIETDGAPAYSVPVRCPEPVAADDAVMSNGLAARDLVASLAGSHHLSAYDYDDGVMTFDLTIEVLPGATYVGPRAQGGFIPDPLDGLVESCERVAVPVRVRARLDGGPLVTSVEREISITRFGAALPAEADVLVAIPDLDAFRADPDPRWLELQFVPRDGRLALSRAKLLWEFAGFEPDAEARNACAGAEAVTTRGLGPSADALVQASAGTWLLCETDHTSYEHNLPSRFAGVHIDEEGAWRALFRDAGLRPGSGFSQQGTIGIRQEPSPGGGFQDFFVLRSSDSAGQALRGIPQGGVAFSSTRNTLRIDRDLLVRSASEVAASEPIPFAPGERAGRAGCEHGETGFAAWASTIADTQSVLRGTWAVCDGYWSQLRFDGESVTFIDAQGIEQLKLGYEQQQVYPADHVALLRLETGVEWWISRAGQPLKLEISHQSGNGRFGVYGGAASVELSAEP